MPDKEHHDILALFRSDDPATVKKLFYQYYPFLCQNIYRIVKDKAIAEDLAQDTFFKFWNKRNELNIETSIKAYLRRMAINEGLYYLRKNKKFQKEEVEVLAFVAADDDIEEQILHQEFSAEVHAAIEELPPRCKEIFKLSRFEELSYKEIAAKLDISIKTVENQMGKALKTLRVALQPVSYTHLTLPTKRIE